MTSADLDRADLDRPGPDGTFLDPSVLAQADRAARAAARAAGVSVRPVAALPELAAIVRLFADIWGRDAAPPMNIELLRAFAKAGNYVGGAFEGEELLGACVGFFGAPDADALTLPALHSHIAGVGGAGSGRGIGFALKLHQRAWALHHGAATILWTFDPLVRRNAYFNLVKLAATPVDYLPDFYGPMTDRINGGGASDRLLVRWHLTDIEVVEASERRHAPATADAALAAGAVTVVGIADDGTPAIRATAGDVPASLVAVPPDIEAVRRRDPAAAAGWRAAVRSGLGGPLADDGRISGFDPAGWYVVTRAASTAPPAGEA